MQHSPITLPPPEALAIIPTPLIAAAIDQLIDALDMRDGDADLEDSEAGETMIDARGRWLPETKIGFDRRGEPRNLETEDNEAAYPEWHTMGRHKGAPLVGSPPPEDAEEDDAPEEDDPSGQCDEDGVNTGGLIFALDGRFYHGPGCPISDPDAGRDEV